MGWLEQKSEVGHGQGKGKGRQPRSGGYAQCCEAMRYLLVGMEHAPCAARSCGCAKAKAWHVTKVDHLRLPRAACAGPSAR